MRLGIEQGLQGEVLHQQPLPLRARACQQQLGVGQIEQTQQVGRQIVSGYLPSLPQTELAHQRLGHLLTGDRWYPRPVRHGAVAAAHRQDECQRPLRRQAPLLLPALANQPLLLHLTEPIRQGLSRWQLFLQITGTGGALQLQLAKQGITI